MSLGHIKLVRATHLRLLVAHIDGEGVIDGIVLEQLSFCLLHLERRLFLDYSKVVVKARHIHSHAENESCALALTRRITADAAARVLHDLLADEQAHTNAIVVEILGVVLDGAE